jgi:RHS repeat-associated protein
VTRDNAGRVIGRNETAGGMTRRYSYGYDSMGRLLRVTKDGVEVETYTYDLNGTRISETNGLRGIDGRSLVYSAEDHLLRAGSASYQYDLDGFLTQKTEGAEVTTYDYSRRGELLQVGLPDGKMVTYEHDPLGRRIAKRVDGVVVEKYLWQGRTRLLAVYDGAENLIQRFAYADGRMPVAMTQAGMTYYLAYDSVGSLRVVTDASGNTVKRIDYDAFGNILADTNPSMTMPFGFAGGLHDRDTGLVRFGYRDYDPDTGRWTAKDPIGFAGGDSDLYGYVFSDPVNFVDPTGQFIATAIVGAVAGGVSGVVTGIKNGNIQGAVLGGVTGAIVGAAVGAILPQWSGLAGEIMAGVVAGAWGGGIGGAVSRAADPCSTGLQILEGAGDGILTGALMGGLNAPFSHLIKLGAGAEIGTKIGETAIAMASESLATPISITHSFIQN